MKIFSQVYSANKRFIDALFVINAFIDAIVIVLFFLQDVNIWMYIDWRYFEFVFFILSLLQLVLSIGLFPFFLPAEKCKYPFMLKALFIINLFFWHIQHHWMGYYYSQG